MTDNQRGHCGRNESCSQLLDPLTCLRRPIMDCAFLRSAADTGYLSPQQSTSVLQFIFLCFFSRNNSLLSLSFLLFSACTQSPSCLFHFASVWSEFWTIQNNKQFSLRLFVFLKCSSSFSSKKYLVWFTLSLFQTNFSCCLFQSKYAEIWFFFFCNLAPWWSMASSSSVLAISVSLAVFESDHSFVCRCLKVFQFENGVFYMCDVFCVFLLPLQFKRTHKANPSRKVA